MTSMQAKTGKKALLFIVLGGSLATLLICSIRACLLRPIFAPLELLDIPAVIMAVVWVVVFRMTLTQYRHQMYQIVNRHRREDQEANRRKLTSATSCQEATCRRSPIPARGGRSSLTSVVPIHIHEGRRSGLEPRPLMHEKKKKFPPSRELYTLAIRVFTKIVFVMLGAVTLLPLAPVIFLMYAAVWIDKTRNAEEHCRTEALVNTTDTAAEHTRELALEHIGVLEKSVAT